MTVKIASQGDKEAIVDALELKNAEDGYGEFGFDRDLASAVVQIGLNREKAFIGVIKGKNGLEATIGLYAEVPWWSTKYFLQDRWMFVCPAYRKSPHGKDLIEFAKRQASGLSLPLQMTIAITEQTANKAGLYERQFKRVRGAIYIYRAADV